jgi:hypothetical protein
VRRVAQPSGRAVGVGTRDRLGVEECLEDKRPAVFLGIGDVASGAHKSAELRVGDGRDVDRKGPHALPHQRL